MKRVVAAVVVLFAVAACADPTSIPTLPMDESRQAAQAPVMSVQGAGTAVAGSYIVVLKSAPGLARAAESARGLGVSTVRHEYNRALRGFSARLTDAEVTRIARDPRVAYVEQDQVFTIDATQTGATWGIDRTDQRNLPLSTTFGYTNTGAGVKVYIIDTGIRFAHNEFGGRASSGFDAVDGGSADDCNGHGTHVAGTVGGTTYGVAKGASLIAVRVLDCSGSGTTSGVIAGIDWVTTNHSAGAPAVANMSLGGGKSTALDNAVSNSIADGVSYAIAAGNSNRDACNFSPARTPAAITVGATTSTDARASYSNYGSCLDIFAPGSSITSSWYTSNSATNTISGTSMATPHVAGVAALYLQGNVSATPSAVRTALVANATAGKVTGAGRNSPNVLLFTNY
ncbi:MAG: S8 family peptidase [Gemmatimonas sp.]